MVVLSLEHHTAIPAPRSITKITCILPLSTLIMKKGGNEQHKNDTENAGNAQNKRESRKNEL
jgi:hypothetical protein